LSSTGAPVALVKRLGFDIVYSHFRELRVKKVDSLNARQEFLAIPLRTANDIAEVHALELWILVR
jgi:hypothetical protein